MDEVPQKWYTSLVMFPGNDGNSGGFSGNPFLGGNGGNAGGPPSSDSLFESAFENLEGELDESAMDELIAASEAREEAKYEFLAVGLHFFDAVKSC